MGRHRKLWIAVFLGALGAAFFWFQTRGGDRPGLPELEEAHTDADEADAGDDLTAAPLPEPRQARDAGSASACRPAALRRCHRGDVWSFSSCNEPEGMLEECGDRRCRGDACEGPVNPRCEEPPEGRCDGQTVVLCRAGQTQRVDCAARGMSCGMGEEGAECVPFIAPELRCGAQRAYCDKNVLVRCERGRLEKTDCGSLRAQCMDLPGARAPSCVRVEPAVLLEGCGPCGCADTGTPEVECDGQDEDRDGHIDEGLDCGPVPIVAFIVTDERGNTSHTPEDIASELERVNQAFGADTQEITLRFELDSVVELSERRLLSLDSPELTQLMQDPRMRPEREEFYIPIVFTDELLAGGGTPKYGLSTLPNGTCGGLQKRAGSETGLIVVAKERAPTTVAHEIGHYLGLCHTHADENPSVLEVVETGRNLTVCGGEMCRMEGDGLCDTPPDPGPPLCAYDEVCDTQCRGGARPDASNLMSYYTACRSRFSRDQMRLMQHTLALRRGWQPCLNASCACTFGGDECPSGMSCRPRVVGDQGSLPRCSLDGPRPKGSDCEDSGQCGSGTLCIQESSRNVRRCVRLCQVSGPGCTCSPASSSFSVCSEDLDVR